MAARSSRRDCNILCSRPGCSEIILAGEPKLHIGSKVVCPGCYGSAWSKANRDNISIIQALRQLPYRNGKPKRTVERIRKACGRPGCSTIIKRGMRRVLIGKIHVCLDCHWSIAERARKYGLTMAQALKTIGVRRKRAVFNGGEVCSRNGCADKLTSGRRKKLGNSLACDSCAAAAQKHARKRGISPEAALKELKRKQQYKKTYIRSRAGCTKKLPPGTARYFIDGEPYCRSCGNTIRRKAKRMNISFAEAAVQIPAK